MAISGVTDVKVDFATKTATVECAKGTDSKLVAAGLKGTYSGTLQ